MQIVLLLILSMICTVAAVWGTQWFLCSGRGNRTNLVLTGIGMLICTAFSVLAEVIIRGRRPLFYYHTHRPGFVTLKVFGLACLFGGLFFALILMTIERKKLKTGASSWLMRSFLFAVCGAAVLEIGFFNFRHFELIGSGAREVHFPSDRIYGQGFYFNRASWKFHPYNYGSSERHLVNYTRRNKIRNITYVFDDGTPRTTVHFSYQDQTHEDYEQIPDHEFIQGIPRSFSIPLHTVGKTYSVMLGLPNENGIQDRSGYGISLPEVIINQVVPLTIEPLRFMLCFLMLFLIAAFFPGSPMWTVELSFASFPQMSAVALLLCLVMLFFGWTVFSSYTGSDLSFTEQKAALNQNYQQYDLLVEALMVPHYALLETPHRYLEQLKDPYDMKMRELKEFGYLWDTSYYNGNYYVYFGVVPAVLVLLPYRMVTGEYLVLDYPILGFSCLFLLGLYGIYSQIVRRCFTRISFGMYWSGLLLLVTALNLTWCLRRTLVYELAITSGICFAAWGIFFMLLAMEPSRLRGLYLFLSGSCSALAVGCRPTMLFVSLVVFTLGFFVLKEEKTLFCRKNVGRVLLFGVPYIAVGLALMKYNYERFGNPLEFGITYQLTTENRAVGIPLLGFYGRLLSVLSSLLKMPVMDMEFPFIHLQVPALPYNGKILNGDMVLGLFAYPLMLFLFGLPAARKRLRKHGDFLLPFCCACLAAALGICITASGFAIANRYLTDYLYLAALPAVFVLFCVFEKCAEVGWERPAQMAALICGIAGVCLFLTLSLTGENQWFRTINPLYFDRLRYAFSPWL